MFQNLACGVMNNANILLSVEMGHIMEYRKFVKHILIITIIFIIISYISNTIFVDRVITSFFIVPMYYLVLVIVMYKRIQFLDFNPFLSIVPLFSVLEKEQVIEALGVEFNETVFYIQLIFIGIPTFIYILFFITYTDNVHKKYKSRLANRK